MNSSLTHTLTRARANTQTHTSVSLSLWGRSLTQCIPEPLKCLKFWGLLKISTQKKPITLVSSQNLSMYTKPYRKTVLNLKKKKKKFLSHVSPDCQHICTRLQNNKQADLPQVILCPHAAVTALTWTQALRGFRKLLNRFALFWLNPCTTVPAAGKRLPVLRLTTAPPHSQLCRQPLTWAEHIQPAHHHHIVGFLVVGNWCCICLFQFCCL